MDMDRWDPPTPPRDLFVNPQDLAQAQGVGVWLGLGDVVQIITPPSAHGESLGWRTNFSVVFNDINSYDSRAVLAGDVCKINKEGAPDGGVWGIKEMPSAIRAVGVRVFGTLALSEVQELVAVHWPRNSQVLDAVSLLCGDSAVRTPRWFSIAADLSPALSPAMYRSR